MAGKIKDTAEKAGHKIAEKATEVGHRVEENMEKAKDWAKEAAHKVGNRVEEAAQKVEHKAKEVFGGQGEAQGACAGIREHMDVYGSCGNKLGRVDHVQGTHDQAHQERQRRRQAPLHSDKLGRDRR